MEPAQMSRDLSGCIEKLGDLGCFSGLATFLLVVGVSVGSAAVIFILAKSIRLYGWEKGWEKGWESIKKIWGGMTNTLPISRTFR